MQPLGICSAGPATPTGSKGRTRAGFVGALDAGVADQILGDFELALGARQMGQVGSVAGWFPRRATLARGVSVPPAAAGGSAAGRPGAGAAAGQAHAPVPWADSAAGGADARSGSACCRTRGWRAARSSACSRGHVSGPPAGAIGSAAFRPVHRRRRQGTAQVPGTIRDRQPGARWTLMLRPDPPHDPRWLDLAPASSGPAARVILPAAREIRPPAGPGPGRHG